MNYTFTYDEATRTGTIKLTDTGDELRITNISRAQAEIWERSKAAEFAKRGFRMQTVPGGLTRGS